MKNVATVDLCFMCNAARREETPPLPLLFQRAKSVTLSGLASRFLITSLLRGISPDGLQHLYLNNLQEFGEFEGVPQDIPLWEKEKTVPWPARAVSRPGPMRTHLAGLVGRWRNLQSLVIDTSSGTQHPHETLRSSCFSARLDEETEEERYREMGDFLRSAAQSLRHFRFEHGRTAPAIDRARRRGPSAGLPPMLDAPRPMDHRFSRYILPEILESDWPHLEAMELYGVAGSSYIATQGKERVLVTRPLGDDTLDQIRTATRGVRRLVIHHEERRFFWMAGVYCRTGIPDPDDLEHDD